MKEGESEELLFFVRKWGRGSILCDAVRGRGFRNCDERFGEGAALRE